MHDHNRTEDLLYTLVIDLQQSQIHSQDTTTDKRLTTHKRDRQIDRHTETESEDQSVKEREIETNLKIRAKKYWFGCTVRTARGVTKY